MAITSVIKLFLSVYFKQKDCGKKLIFSFNNKFKG